MLLSIIIPTKNRQYTSLYAIESALSVHESDIEVIIQDCSDEDTLRSQIVEKFGLDSRIKYFYTNSKPSMTDNWNEAFERAEGDYICAIGDDDAIMKHAYNVALWARDNNIRAVSQKEFVIYTWPGYTPQLYNGTLNYGDNFTDEIFVKDDLQERIKEYSTLASPMGYMFLPQCYHSIFSKSVINSIKKETGVFLDSVSLDIYSSIVFSKVLDKYGVSNRSYTIRGACSSSNTQRSGTKKVGDHIKEFKKVGFTEEIPAIYDINTVIWEAFIKACKAINQEHLIKSIDLPRMYANIVINDADTYSLCVEKLNTYVPVAQRKNFYAHINAHRRLTNRLKVTDKIKKIFPFLLSFYRKLKPLPVQRSFVQAATITDAIEILEQKSSRV